MLIPLIILNLASGGGNIDSVADPAAFSFTPSTATSTRQLVSSADPAAFALSLTAATATRQIPSSASPAAFTLTVSAADGDRSIISSASPAAWSLAPTSASAYRALASSASPAAYSLSASPATATAALLSSASPAAFTMTPSSATGEVTKLSVALPAAFALSPSAVTTSRNYVSVALPAAMQATFADAASAYRPLGSQSGGARAAIIGNLPRLAPPRPLPRAEVSVVGVPVSVKAKGVESKSFVGQVAVSIGPMSDAAQIAELAAYLKSQVQIAPLKPTAPSLTDEEILAALSLIE